MPGEVKQLYLGKCIADLNTMAGELPKVGNVRQFIKSADRLYQAAEECKLHGDREKAYVMYMKYFNIVSAIKKTNEYKKDMKFFSDMIGSRKCMVAINEAEKLAEDLKNRYDKRQAEILSEKMLEKNERRLREEEKEKEEEVLPEEEKSVTKSPVSISAEELYALMDEKTPLIIMDTRLEEDFEESHMNKSCCINIPESIIPAGILVKNIQKNLPSDSLMLWEQRSKVEYIVIMGWRSTVADLVPGNVINNLKDALYKWDQDTLIKSEPLVLEGGYEEWLFRYAPLTTNSQPSRMPPRSSTDSGVPSLDSIVYDLDSEILLTPQQIAEEKKARELKALEEAKKRAELAKNMNQGEEKELLKRPINAANTPTVDRTVKPKPVANDIVQTNKNNLNNIKLTNNLKDLRQVMNEDKTIRNTNMAKKQLNEAPKIPSVDRNLKPATSNTSLPQKVSNVDMEKERAEYETLMLKKKQAQEDVERLEKLKMQGAKETAQLMRTRKKVEEDMANEQREKTLEAEKTLDSSPAKQVTEPKQSPPTEKRQIETSVAEADKEDGLKQAAAKKAEEERAEQEQEEEEEWRLAKEKREREEIEMKAKQETEKKEKELREKMEKERYEKERLAKEEAAKTQKEEEKKRKEEEEEKKKQEELQHSRDRPQGKHHTPGLPVGWEKRLDASTGRYFYLDHQRNTTQWVPPTTPAAKAPPKGIYTAKLKEEAEASGGLTRSHSSPNITKMVQDEEAESRTVPRPLVERTSKPRPKADTLQIKTDVSAAKVRNLNPTWGSVAPGLCGLRNIGNTCYMNSIIQCLSNTIPLTVYFLSDLYVHDINKENVFGKGGVIAEEYSVVSKALWSGQYKSINPRDLWSTLGRFYSLFASHEHQDSQELLLFLMDGLHEDLNKVKKRPQLPEQNNNGISDQQAALTAWKMHKQINESIVVELFQGQFKSTVTCLMCRKESVTFDAFVNLSLPIAQGSRASLYECVSLFSKRESMTGESRWDCPQCKCKREASKCIVVWKLPPILIIHLKRFYYRGMWRDKITTHVDYPLDNLDMSGFVAGPKTPPAFNLYAVSNHYGTLDGGHYTASVKNAKNHKWYKYDDTEVYEVSKSDVQSSAGYILFYSSMRMDQMLK